MNSWIAVFIGGGLGSMLRFGISRWLGVPGSGFPWATFWANLLACLVLGLGFFYFTRKGEIPSHFQWLVLTGFCGGFSTFSTFSLETLHLLQTGQTGLALMYVGSSLGTCLLLLWGITLVIK